MIACVVSPVPSPTPGMPFASLQAQHSLLVLYSSTSEKRHDSASLSFGDLKAADFAFTVMGKIRLPEAITVAVLLSGASLHMVAIALCQLMFAPTQSVVSFGVKVLNERAI
ncbi:TPA: hypothetical protein ACH3X1_002203 [Trebouxia sp. C0004]